MPHQKLINHLRARISHTLKKKVRFELWFFIALLAVVVIVFLVIQSLFLSLATAVKRGQLEVTNMDERTIYTSFEHELRDDFKLLLKTQPSLLNGAEIEQNVAKGQAMAVVVENYTPIRHMQEGLEGAAVVYEAPAEGGITRFLAIYDGSPVATIGPVRSARPYFITWASELRAGFVHIGGSPDALNNLKSNFRVFNIDEFSDAKTIWRNYDYLAPHNAFTSTNNILKRLNKEKYRYPVTSKRFIFKEPEPTSGDIQNISIDFSINPYKVKYAYDPTTKTYLRYNGGKRHAEIKPSNIIVQFVETKVLDSVGRLYVQTHGTGKALVFRDGKVIEGTWEKDASINSDDQEMSQSWTKFFDKEGAEIEMNKGQIWIEIVPEDRPVNYF